METIPRMFDLNRVDWYEPAEITVDHANDGKPVVRQLVKVSIGDDWFVIDVLWTKLNDVIGRTMVENGYVRRSQR